MTDNQQTVNIVTTDYIDLAAERLGGETLGCSDDFFAAKENLLKPGRGVFIDDKYTERGKWMDGWESRRSFGRDNGRDYDWCTIRLGIPGVIAGVDIDTHHFRGNAPAFAAIEACYHEGPLTDSVTWTEILPQSPTQAHSQNVYAIDSQQVWTHIRLNIYPDGGVARLRVYGQPHINWNQFLPGELIDLAAISHGACAVDCSDMFFSNKDNLLMPGRGINMGDGWETKRRRDNGHDWVVVKLATGGSVHKVEVDTHHFKGNFPDRFSLEACYHPHSDNLDQASWQTLISETSLYAHRQHSFSKEAINNTKKTFTHIRLNIFPDGGVSRLRIYGYREE